MREWLQLFRAQTVPATVFTILIPYLIAGGNNPLVILLIILLGTLLHFASFGHNSVMDYWYDVKDPNKKHHPLPSGRIGLDVAHKVIHNMLVIVTSLAVITAFLLSPKPELALTFLVLYLIFGHAYNDGLDRNWEHSWIPISLCFTFLAMYGWFLASSTIDVRLLLIALWSFLTIFYQIAWEGNLKDLWSPGDVKNPLRVYTDYDFRGVPIVFKNVFISRSFMLIRILGNTGVLILLGVVVNTSLASLVLFAVLSAFEVYKVMDIHETAEHVLWLRDYLLESFGLAEASEFFRIIVVGVSLTTALLLILYGIVWFILMNKYLWKTWFGPKV